MKRPEIVEWPWSGKINMESVISASEERRRSQAKTGD